MQLLTQELICARKHYQLKKLLLPWRWEHLSHSALFFPDQGASGQAQHQTGPVLHDAQLAHAGIWWRQQNTFASPLLLQHWYKLIATHPNRATLNDKLGMLLKHFPEQWIKRRVSSEVNRTDYFFNKKLKNFVLKNKCILVQTVQITPAASVVAPPDKGTQVCTCYSENEPLSPTETFGSYTIFCL